MNPGDSTSAGGCGSPKFPAKLHFLLKELLKDGLEDVASWQPHGRCFIVHKPKDFETKILPFYFQQSKFTSFQRQLSFYGFRRVPNGADKGAYYHEMFLRGHPELANLIVRTKVKSTGPRKSDGLDCHTPNFYEQRSEGGSSSDVVPSNGERGPTPPFLVSSGNEASQNAANASLRTFNEAQSCHREKPSVTDCLQLVSSSFLMPERTVHRPVPMPFNPPQNSWQPTLESLFLSDDVRGDTTRFLPSIGQQVSRNRRSGADLLRIFEAAQRISNEASGLAELQRSRAVSMFGRPRGLGSAELLQFARATSNMKY